MKRLRLTIRGKVVVACLVLLLFMGGFSAAMVALNAQMGDLALGLYDKTFVGMHYAEKVQTAFVRLEGHHTDADLPLTQDDDTAAIASMLNDLDVAADRAATPKQRTGVATAKADLQALISTAPTPDRPTLAQVDKHLKRLTQRFVDDAVDRRDAADGLITEVRTTIFGLAAVALVGALLFAASLMLSVVSPLHQVIRVIKDGDRTAIPPRLNRRTDEIGQMVKALGDQREAARTLESDRVEAARIQRATAEVQAGIVASLSTGLRRLAVGDLTYRISDPFPPEFERLRADFNQALANLRAALAAVAGAAEGINTGSDEISAAADELSRRTEQQAASLEETAAAMDQLTHTAHRAAEGAVLAADMVQAAEAAAVRSGPIVRQAVRAMEEIESSAQKIRKITGLIDEIAVQTNLLALNASIEAARTGEAGRGFAVVALEVRALAQRSAEAAKEINGLIQDCARQVESGVKLVQNTGVALEDISGNVGQTTGVVTDIAASSREQAETLNQVNVAVNEMDRMTQQNAAMVERTTAASHALASRAVELLSLVREFDLGGAAAVAVREAA